VSFESKSSYKVVHTIKATQYSAFAATGRAYEGSDRVLGDRDCGVADGSERAIVKLLDMAIDHHVAVTLGAQLVSHV
jgi:hypothetical protein